MIERSLHYYFLAPLRREVLVIGKWIAGVTAAAFVFGLGVLACFVFMYIHHGAEGRDYLLRSPGPAQLAAYLGVTVLATVGYGALFLLTGLLFRNPIIPAAVILLWEGINHVLPSSLQKLSVIHYLEPLCPVEVPLEGLTALFGVSSNPTSPWLAVPGLLLVAGAILMYACIRIRRVEIDYGTD
jgi:ABC-type transport system involved in multi-copper enzyme maturation permease subunit